MIDQTPLNILLELCTTIFIAIIYVFNIKKELK